MKKAKKDNQQEINSKTNKQANIQTNAQQHFTLLSPPSQRTEDVHLLRDQRGGARRNIGGTGLPQHPSFSQVEHHLHEEHGRGHVRSAQLHHLRHGRIVRAGHETERDDQHPVRGPSASSGTQSARAVLLHFHLLLHPAVRL